MILSLTCVTFHLIFPYLFRNVVFLISESIILIELNNVYKLFFLANEEKSNACYGQ